MLWVTSAVVFARGSVYPALCIGVAARVVASRPGANVIAMADLNVMFCGLLSYSAPSCASASSCSSCRARSTEVTRSTATIASSRV